MSITTSLKNIHSKYIGTPEKWKEFLILWEQKRVSLNLDHQNQFIWSESHNINVIKEKILTTENRLGANLPKSYKDFIIATDWSYTRVVAQWHIF